jgi:hypothetical protein|tara:strand:+ start:204 stop:878 length:675 start_codon:yes stop_codon:yes gene_type:complete
MAQQNYTNRMGKLANTNNTSIYTVPDQKMAIINSARIANTDASNATTITIQFLDSDDTAFTFYQEYSVAAGAEVYVFERPFFLDEKEEIKLEASASNDIEYIFSLVEVDQGVNNKYLNKMHDHDTTGKITLYTVPDDRTALIMNFTSVNYSASTPTGAGVFANAAGTEFQIDSGTMAAKTSYNHLVRTQVLQEKETIKFTAGTADQVNTLISVLEMSKAGGSTA